MDKRLNRVLSVPTDLTWDELASALASVGFDEMANAGGSSRTFVDKSGRKIILHRPHPTPYVKRYAIREILSTLSDYAILPRRVK